MKRLLNPRLVVAVIVLALGASIYVASLPTTEAIVIGGPHVCVYYSNKSYSQPVGARGTGCCGEPISWGSTSKYVRCEPLYCLDVLCPF